LVPPRALRDTAVGRRRPALFLPQEFRAWVKQAGFASTQCIHLVGSTYAAVAWKA
jgi:hypothetical protein